MYYYYRYYYCIMFSFFFTVSRQQERVSGGGFCFTFSFQIYIQFFDTNNFIAVRRVMMYTRIAAVMNRVRTIVEIGNGRPTWLSSVKGIPTTGHHRYEENSPSTKPFLPCDSSCPKTNVPFLCHNGFNMQIFFRFCVQVIIVNNSTRRID